MFNKIFIINFSLYLIIVKKQKLLAIYIAYIEWTTFVRVYCS